MPFAAVDPFAFSFRVSGPKLEFSDGGDLSLAVAAPLVAQVARCEAIAGVPLRNETVLHARLKERLRAMARVFPLRRRQDAPCERAILISRRTRRRERSTLATWAARRRADELPDRD